MKPFKGLTLLAGLGLFAWILGRSDLGAVWAQIKAFHWRFGLILLFYAVIFALDTVGWGCALSDRARGRVRWDHLFRARLAGEAVNYMTPTAWIGGEPVKAVLLQRRFGVPMEEGIASVVVAKTTFSFSMLLFVLAGLLVAFATHPIEGSLFRWVWVVLPVLSLLLSLFLAVQFFEPFRRVFGVLQRILPEPWRTKGQGMIGWDEALTRFYRESPRAVLWSLSFHFLGWMAGVIEVYLILRFLQIPVSWGTAWSIEALWVLLRSGAFLIPASLGASEGFLLLICSALGINAVSALALGLIRRARELAWVGMGLAEFSRG